MNADEKVSTARLKKEYNQVMLETLEDILKMIHGRTYHVKNAIEFLRFQSGMGL